MHPRGSGGRLPEDPKGEKMQKVSWTKRHPRSFLDKYPTEQDFLDAFPRTLMERIRESAKSRDFLKGFVTASLIIILLHLGLAYYLVLS